MTEEDEDIDIEDDVIFNEEDVETEEEEISFEDIKNIYTFRGTSYSAYGTYYKYIVEKNDGQWLYFYCSGLTSGFLGLYSTFTLASESIAPVSEIGYFSSDYFVYKGNDSNYYAISSSGNSISSAYSAISYIPLEESNNSSYLYTADSSGEITVIDSSFSTNTTR